MAIKAQSSTITLIDLTDGYSVVLTNDNYTFLGTTNSVSGTQTTTCMVQALCGAEQVSCSVETIDAPTGLSIVSDNKTPVPTLTITATSALTKSGSVVIPVKIGDITISKTFSYSISFRGANGTSVTVKSTSIQYQVSTSGTTEPAGTWQDSVPSVPAGQFLWTKTVVTYSDNKTTTAYSVSRSGTNGSNGSNGTSVTVSSTATTYQVGSSGTTKPTGTWQSIVPATSAGQFLWTKTVVTFSDGKTAESFSVSRNGTNGANGSNGKDAIIINVVSTGGTIFKNTDIATTLNAYVYQGGVEKTGSALTTLGTIKWYKDEETTAIGTGSTLTIQAGDVLNKASYVAKLEG